MRAFALALLVTALAGFAQDNAQVSVDPSLRAAVERFYAAQEAEDVAAYLSLWASSAQRPRPEQLKYLFDSGDDTFSQLTIRRVNTDGDRTTVRASVTRDRTSATARRPDGMPMTFHMPMDVVLTFVREGSDWKLVREGSAMDALADALIAAPTSEDREKLIVAEPGLPAPAVVQAISRQADAFAQNRAFPRAQKLYELALELATRLEQPKLQSELLQNIGNTMYYQRNFAGALRTYEQRLALERAAANDEGIATALVGIATAHYSQFEYTDALVSYREALAIHERRNDIAATAMTLVSTGNVQFVQGDFAGAIADYRRSRALSLKALDKRGEARALEGLGRSFAAQGDFVAALEAYARVLEQGRIENDRAMQGTALSSIGQVHFRLGNPDTARDLFDQSRLHFESLNDLSNVGRLWQAIGLTDLVSSRFVPAEQEYGRSSAACATAQDSDCVAHAIVGLAFAQAAQEHFEPAILSYRKAIAAFTSLKKREDAARAELGLSQALAGTRDYAGALSVARHVREEGAAIGQDDVVWRALVAEARALRRLSNPARALTAAKAAVATVDRMAQAALDRPNEPLPADTTGAYALLAVLQAEGRDAAGAFVTVERRRAHALRAALATNERDIARGMTTTEREDERQLAAEVVSIRARVVHEKGLPKPDAARLARLQQTLAAAVEKRRAHRQQLFTRLPELPMWRGLGAPATLDEAAGLLRAEGDLLAEFVIDDEDLLVVVLARRPEGPECRTYMTSIWRQALAERIARAVEPAALRSVAEWRVASADLMNAIPAGAWTAIAAAPRAIIAPDDVLWRVPFEALAVEAGVLADRTTVMYAGSATSLVRVPQATSPPDGLTVLMVGTPDLPASARERVKATSPGWTLPAAGAAGAELRTIASLFEDPAVTALSGAAATEASLRMRAGGASILHVAAPFRMNGASPLFSPILLSTDSAVPDPPADNNGVLEMREVMNLDLHARVAVLSDGASAAMRDAAPSADTVRWAWRAAGIPSIVLSRWSVDDTASATMLKEMYGRLKDGDEPDAALQGARTAVRARENTSAPYFWAGWMVVGR